MLKNWLLINYAGFPYTPTSLMPDNGLANLAGAIKEAGGTSLILDYSTVSVLQQLTSPDLTRKLIPIYVSGNQDKEKLSILKTVVNLVTLYGCERERNARLSKHRRQVIDQISAGILTRNISAVGFKLWNGDGILGSIQIANTLRKRFPGLKIFGGGPHVDIFMENLLTFEAFDAFVYGEGENTVKQLCASDGTKAELREIKNLIYRDQGQTVKTAGEIIANLDELPMPLYDPETYPAMAGDEKIKIIVLDESRGCNNHCAYCIHPIKSNQCIRVKSTERLLKEIKRAKDLYQAQVFRFAGSSTPFKLLNEFASAVTRSRTSITYSSFGHIRDSHEADFNLLKESGCRAMFFGIESGSSKILAKLCKGIEPGKIAETIDRVKEAGIFMVGSLIFPTPGETDETKEETLELLSKHKPDAAPIHFPIIIPRTDWYENPQKYGLSFDKRKYLLASLQWKAKMIMPPMFWSELPFSMDGKKYHAIIAESAAFIKMVEKLGICTSMTDEMYIMSLMLERDHNVFRSDVRRLFFTGDYPAIKEMVATMNQGGRKGKVGHD
jgi:radical SAM superfamily enzyme YgiQ (UPF0313 family)